MVHANSANQWPYLPVILVKITSDCSCTYSIVGISKHNTSLPVLFCYTPRAWMIMGVEETLAQMYIALVLCLWLVPHMMQHCLPSKSQYTWEANASSLSPCVHTSAQIWVPVCPAAPQSNHGYWVTMISAVLAWHSPLTVPVPPIHQELCKLQMRLRPLPSPTNSLLPLEQNMLYNVSQQSCNTILWKELGIWLAQITHFYFALFEYPSWPTFFTCSSSSSSSWGVMHFIIFPMATIWWSNQFWVCVSVLSIPRRVLISSITSAFLILHKTSVHLTTRCGIGWAASLPTHQLLWINFINFCVKWVMSSSKLVYQHTLGCAGASWISIPWSCQ